MGQPWTAAAFVVFFTSRVARSEIKRRRPEGGASGHLAQFLYVTTAGWLGAGVLAAVAAIAGEGQEWMFVAPLFLLMGGLNLYVARR